MTAGILLAVAAVALQALGKVLYGAHLEGISVALFVLVGATAGLAIFQPASGFRRPTGGLRLAAANNLWTAVGFLSFFYALKHLPPATVAATEIGVSLLAAVAAGSWRERALPPVRRLAACGGILAGCALLAGAELGSAEFSTAMLLAFAASMLAGVAAAFSATVSRGLALAGWSPLSVLAHRFYLTIAATAAWVLWDGAPLPGESAMLPLLAVCAVALLAPMLLMQQALRRIDALTVLICMAAQPMLSFAFAMTAAGDAFDSLALAGVAVVTAFLALDIAGGRQPPAAARRAGRKERAHVS